MGTIFNLEIKADLLLTPPVLTILFRQCGSSGSAYRLLTALSAAVL